MHWPAQRRVAHLPADNTLPLYPGFDATAGGFDFRKFGHFLKRTLVPCPGNNFMKLRRIFRRWQGGTTSSGRPHGRRSNAVNGEKDRQIREVITGTGHQMRYLILYSV